MPDLKISQLPVATTPLAGTELVPIVQGGTTDQTTVQAIMTSTVPSGTANGVLYLNGSKVATSGSALTFDGTNFTTTGYAEGNGLRSLGGNPVRFYNAANSNWSQISAPAGTGDMQFDTGAGEQMRLTSTGLGIGTSSPASKLEVYNSAVSAAFVASTPSTWRVAQVRNDGTANANNAAGIAFVGRTDVNPAGIVAINSTTGGGVTSLAFLPVSGNTPFEAMRLDSSGNLGLGVTPSAWSGYSAFQFGQRGAVWANQSGGDVHISANYYFGSGADRYISSGAASYYRQNAGVHSWGTAPSGTAGNAISFTQAMTLDADGELGVGITSPTARLHAYSATAMKQLTVDGTGSIKTGVNLANGGTTYGQIYFDNNAPYDMSVVQQYTTGSLIFGTNSTERARITSTGNVVAGGSVALATTATDGFLYVPTCAGTPTGTPTAITGMAPIVVDTTNNKMYFYSGGAWRDAGP